MSELLVDGLHPAVSVEAQLAIADLVLSWGGFDTALSWMLIVSFGLKPDDGAILIGAMDSKTKLDRLQKGFEHHGNNAVANSIRTIRKQHEAFSDVRNKLAHWRCIGTDDKGWLAFTAYKHVHKQIGSIQAALVDISEIRAAAMWATNAASSLNCAAEQLTQQQESQKPAV